MPSHRALVGVLAAGAALFVKVRQPVQLGKAVGVIDRHHMHLHLAEAPGQGHLRGRVQVERREDQHLVAQEGLVQRVEGLR